jgi:hypothetical protein
MHSVVRAVLIFSFFGMLCIPVVAISVPDITELANQTCKYNYEFSLVSSNRSFQGLDEFSPYLVGGQKAKAWVEAYVEGNQSKEAETLDAEFRILCTLPDGSQEDRGGMWGSPNITYLKESNQTKLVWEENYFVPPESGFCFINGRVYGQNRTWEMESGCQPSNCLCNVFSLVSLPDGATARIISIGEYLANRDRETVIQTSKDQSGIMFDSMIIALVSAIFVFVSAYAALRAAKSSERSVELTKSAYERNEKFDKAKIFNDFMKEERALDLEILKAGKRSKPAYRELLLNFYEGLAVLNEDGLIDDNILEKHYKDSIIQVCENISIRNDILKYRKMSTDAFKSLERLYRKLGGKKWPEKKMIKGFARKAHKK